MQRQHNRPEPTGTRQFRVGELVRHALTETLRRDAVRDPAVVGRSITVCEVSLSPDLRNAIVFVEPLGGGDSDEVVDGLNRSARYLSGQVARSVRLKYAPKLSFRRDQSFNHARHIDSILRSDAVKRDLDDGAA